MAPKCLDAAPPKCKAETRDVFREMWRFQDALPEKEFLHYKVLNSPKQPDLVCTYITIYITANLIAHCLGVSAPIAWGICRLFFFWAGGGCVCLFVVLACSERWCPAEIFSFLISLGGQGGTKRPYLEGGVEGMPPWQALPT